MANVGRQDVASTLFCGMDPADEANQDARCADVCADQGGKGCIYDFADARDSICVSFPDAWVCTSMANWGELTGTVDCGAISLPPTFAPTETPKCDDIDPQCMTVCGYESCCVITDDSSGVGIRDPHGTTHGGQSRDVCLGNLDYPPPADGHTHTWCPNRLHCAPTTTTTTTVATTTTIPSKDWCADVCGEYGGIGCVKFPANAQMVLECIDRSEYECERRASAVSGGTLFCSGATGVTKTFGNPFIVQTLTLDASHDWCTDVCGDLSGCIEFDYRASYRAPHCDPSGHMDSTCLWTPNSIDTGSVLCAGYKQESSGHVGSNLFLGPHYGKGTSPYYPEY